MSVPQGLVFATLLLTLVLFVSGRWRYDVVALLALLIVTLTGLVPAARAFAGFSNPAVITVAAVLVLSRGLQNSGVVDLLGERLLRLGGGVTVLLAALTGIVTFLSAFMNNIGALALMLPVALQVARKKGVSPSVFLMPMAFASLLGGMTTLIGTPPNIIAASFRAQTGAPPFRMFDFTPVGLGVAVAGVLFIALIGWRLIPQRRGQAAGDGLFDVASYFTEVRLPPDSRLVGRPLSEINRFVANGVNVLGLVRAGERRLAPPPRTVFQAGDILILQADAENLAALVNKAGVALVGSERIVRDDVESDEVTLVEAVVMPNSLLVGETAYGLDLRRQHGVNLLAIARQGRQMRTRLDRVRLRAGDVLLLQCHTQTVKDILATLDCLPLAARNLRLGGPKPTFVPVGIFAAALLLSAVGVVSVPVAFLAAVVLLIVGRFVSLQEAYDSVDWPIIVLLGAMIPVGEALETTGAAQLVADTLLRVGDRLSPAALLVVVLVATMFLSDIINNAAAVVLMAPIGIGVAQGLSVSADPFLMAIAIGASCAFLTPIGHQSNTLVMGPGGYRFGDYWRMGLVLEVIVVLVAVPLLLVVWPW